MKNVRPRRIFRPAPTDPLVRNAVVNFDPSLSRLPIATGYRMAARRLVDDVLANGGDQDFLVGPISYLYRHAIELALKHIIATGYELLDRSEGVPHHHDLSALWLEARAVILSVDARAGDECVRVDGEIAELAEVDPASDAFRYPTRRDGRSAWPADLSLIDLQNLGESMDSLAERLEAAGDMLDMTLDAEREWSAEVALAQDRP